MLKTERKLQGTQSDGETWIRVPSATSVCSVLDLSYPLPMYQALACCVVPPATHCCLVSGVLVLNRTLDSAVTFSTSDLLQLLADGLILHSYKTFHVGSLYVQTYSLG